MTTAFQQWAEAQANPEVVVNDNFATLLALAAYGRDPEASAGLIWGHMGTLGGPYNGNTIAKGTVALTDNATNYVVVLRSSGVVSVSTTSTNSLDPLYAKLYKVTAVSGAVTAIVDQRLDTNGLFLATAAAANPTQCIPIAVSDETTALTTGTAKVTFRMPYAFTLTEVRGSLTTAATGATLFAFNVKESGTTIFSTTPTFDASEKTTTTAATPAVISDASLADDAEITIDISAVGSTIAGAGLKVYLIGHRT